MVGSSGRYQLSRGGRGMCKVPRSQDDYLTEKVIVIES